MRILILNFVLFNVCYAKLLFSENNFFIVPILEKLQSFRIYSVLAERSFPGKYKVKTFFLQLIHSNFSLLIQLQIQIPMILFFPNIRLRFGCYVFFPSL
jgi:hypothetical protein